jgi:hypothetical protein
MRISIPHGFKINVTIRVIFSTDFVEGIFENNLERE